MKVIKRDGREVEFDGTKIANAIKKANNSVVASTDKCNDTIINMIISRVGELGELRNRALAVEEIQDIVEDKLIEFNLVKLAKNYIKYRYERSLARKANTIDDSVLSIVERNNEEIKQENSNKNCIINSTQRDYIAGEVSKDITQRMLLPKDVIDAHNDGIIHFHDMDYFIGHMHNCDLINLEDMLMNNTVISETLIEQPKSFSTACNIATQIIAQVASQQYGGQSISLSHLVPFVEISRQKYRKEVKEELNSEYLSLSEEQINRIAEKRLRKEVKDGVQTIQYQIITLMTTNGQAPFITVFMYLNEVDEDKRADLALIIEETLKQRTIGVKNEKGVYVTPAFPKLIYVLQEDNITPDGKYYYLTELAAKCTAKRMVPDYISEKKMLELKVDKNGDGNVYTCMGCRSFLTPYIDSDKKSKYYGRFNQGVVSINLPYIALMSNGDQEKFWNNLDNYLELCHKALKCRHNRLKGTPSDVAPILWQHGALARLKPGELIDDLLYGGYSTISLGYAGLYECTRCMTGNSHTDEKGKNFALSVMQKLNDKCKQWKEEENIDYSVYGTPLESVTYKFAKANSRNFDIVEEVNDHDYVTNSYHVNVRENIDAFSKLSFESPFQNLSPGGAISYIEIPNLDKNIDAIITVLQHIYENIMYAELNTRSDYCMECGYEGEIQIVENEDGKLIWECPNCGNRKEKRMNVTRRTCGLTKPI